MENTEPEEKRAEIIQTPSAMEAIQRAEVDIQIATAKRFPMHERIHEFLTKAKKMVLLDRETAEKCTYALPRGKGEAAKMIRGPSTHFAHSIACAWGNIRVQSRIIGVDETAVTVQGVALDLEGNYAISADVRKGIVDRNGRKYSTDMITMTCMGASSIARRNAILNVIPRSAWFQLWQETQTFAHNQDKRTLAEQRQAAIAYFEKRGVTAKRLLETLDKKGIEDLDSDDIDTLRGIRVALEDNETTIDEAFPLPVSVKKSSDMPSLAEVMEAKLKKGAADVQPPKEREPGMEG